MEYENNEKKCPIVEVDGFIERGKQFDIEINLPEDERNVIYGVIKDCYREPVCDAVVKLVELDCEKGEEIRKPVSHTFTNEYGEFVFGPLCPDKKYAIDVWASKIKTYKICARCSRKGKCLKGVKMDQCDKYIDKNPCDLKPEPCEPCEKPCGPCNNQR